MRQLWTFCLFVGACLSAAPALAGLTICNETDARQSIAIGYKDGDNWTSEGWWTVRPGDCTTPVKGDLANRYYYYRATNPDRPFEGEDYYFCTDPKAFTIVGDTDCQARGYREEEFSQIDTGPEALDFTFTLLWPEDREDGDKGGEGILVTPAPEATDTEPAQPDSFGGSFGEAISGTGVFLGCQAADGTQYCEIQTSEEVYRAYTGSGVSDALDSQMLGVAPGTTVQFSGDVVTYEDGFAEIVLTSIDASAPAADPPAPQPQIPTFEVTPGRYGEPFTLRGATQDCDAIDGAYFCDVHVDGWRFRIFQDERTPKGILDALGYMPPATPVEIEGDIVTQGDMTVEAVLRRVTRTGSDPFAALRADLSGAWMSESDNAYEIDIYGGLQTEYYNSEFQAEFTLDLAESCPASGGAGPVMLLRERGGEPETICMIIDSVAAEELVLIVPGLGQEQRFTRMN